MSTSTRLYPLPGKNYWVLILNIRMMMNFFHIKMDME